MIKITLFGIGLLFILSCKESATQKATTPSFDHWTNWLLKNEDKMNVELNKRFFVPSGLQKNERLDDESFVVLKNDTTILGEFAKLLSDYDPCLVTTYTLFSDTTKHKIINIVRYYTSPCIIDLDSVFVGIDSTEHFVIHKLTEPYLNERISIGHQSINPANLRFHVTKIDTSFIVDIYINPDNVPFELSEEVEDSLPRLLFGDKLLRTKISKINVRLRSLPGVKNETIGQLQRILY